MLVHRKFVAAVRLTALMTMGLALGVTKVSGSRAPDHAAPATTHEASAKAPAAPASDATVAGHAGHDAPAPRVAAPAPQSPDGLQSAEAFWADLMEGNRRFVDGRPFPREYLLTRNRLAGGQHPPVIVLACADSRVAPELVFDKNLGELFVVRTAGNIADAITLGSIEYAAEHLDSRLLVVMGHEKCGAVTAAASGATMPSPNLQMIVERITPSLANSVAYHQHKPIGMAEINANARYSAAYCLRNSPVLAHLVKEGKLEVVAAVYSLTTGEVTRLDGDFLAGENDGHE